MPYNQLIKPVATSRTLGYVLFLASLVGAYSGFAYWIEVHHPVLNEIPSEFHAALSLVLGWLLVFRTNTAYNRWWEARTLWGNLVNASRNTAVKLMHVGRLTMAEKEKGANCVISFSWALKSHLRREIDTHLSEEIRELVGKGTVHVPLEIVRQIYEIVGTAVREGRVSDAEFRIFDADMQRLMDVCGGCERILNTPIVASYRVFVRQCVFIFLATLPWGVVHDFGGWVIPMSIITAYFMLGLETVAEHVEEPFGYDDDDLDLDSLCNTITSTVNEVLSYNQPNIVASTL